jgi:hypothetical protein
MMPQFELMGVRRASSHSGTIALVTEMRSAVSCSGYPGGELIEARSDEPGAGTAIPSSTKSAWNSADFGALIECLQ